MYLYRCLENIKKLYKSTGKCDYQQQYNAIIEAEIISTTERFTDNSTISSGPYVTTKKPIARKTFSLFTEVFDIKKKADVRRVGAAKSKRK